MLERESYELMVTDCHLPALEGPELVRAAKKIDPWLPIICVSVELSTRLRRECREAGADLVLIKPTDLELLEYVVRGQLKSSEVAHTWMDSKSFRTLEEMIAALTERPREPLVRAIMDMARSLRLERLEAAAGASLQVLRMGPGQRADLEEICDWLLFELERIWNRGLVRNGH